jgi:3-deoxy-D-manno-octulosonic acid kinase
MSRILGDRYLLSRRIRPYHETRVSEEARRRGIPTPRVLAAALYPGGLFYRGDLVTEFIPDSVELVDALFDTSRKGAGGAAERMDALKEAGSLIRRLAAVGLQHRDLHAGNILLEWQGASPRSYLLDLDRCDIASGGRTVSARPMFLRLRRSLMKWERETAIRLTDGEWGTLEAAVGG